MIEYRLGEMERKFADIIWKNEPIFSRDLVKVCEKELNWKKSTTYTILHRLCEKGLFLNLGGAIVSHVTKEQFLAKQSVEFVENHFAGSLSQFVAAFTSAKYLSKEEIKELWEIIGREQENNRL